MGKFGDILLVSDFDDTLYGENMQVAPANLTALEYFTREGGIFTVATGRAHPTFAPHARCTWIWAAENVSFWPRPPTPAGT